MFTSRRFLNDTVGIVVALVGLTAVLLFSLGQWVSPDGRFPGSIRNRGPEGAQSLAAWLVELGYNVRPVAGRPLSPLPEDRVMFILAPEGDFDTLELTSLIGWVRSGGTLIIAQEANDPGQLLDRFDVSVGLAWPSVAQASWQLPTLNWPWVGDVTVETSRRLRVDCDDTAVHLGTCRQAILVSRGQGLGQVFVMSSIYPFTNEGLQNGSNAQFVRNLVRATAVPGETIVFDEVHRDTRSSWLVQSREGWSLLLTILIIIAYAIAQQQKFGQPRPTTEQFDPERRKTAEFIASIATVDKTGQHTALRRHYWQRLKRKIGRRYGLDPALPDQLFLVELKGYMDDEEMGTLITILMSMQEPQVTVYELMNWIELVLEMGQGGNQ